jgi:mediator of RNA polymerase II transcription subunit 8
MDEGRKMLASLPTPNDAMFGTAANQNQAKEKALEDVWGTTRDACGARIAGYVMNEEGDYFTAEEHELGIENVRTGLRRTFDDEYEDDEDDEDEDEGDGANNGGDDDVMVIDRPPPPPAPAISTQEVEGATIETIMRLATRGQLVG